MTIRHFFFTAACGIWLYVILCLWVKLALDGIRQHSLRRKMKRIRSLFAPGGELPGEKALRKLERLGKDLLLTECACISYRKCNAAYTDRERSQKRKFLQHLLENGVETGKKNPECCCALVSMSHSCGIPLKAAERILSGYGTDSELAAYWAGTETEKERNR